MAWLQASSANTLPYEKTSFSDRLFQGATAGIFVRTAEQSIQADSLSGDNQSFKKELPKFLIVMHGMHHAE
jgi:hypothetical protein